MESENSAKKANFILKKLERYLSIKTRTKPFTRSRSWHSSTNKKANEKTRHRMAVFGMLLEDAELEYGFKSEGPLLIPCNTDLFAKSWLKWTVVIERLIDIPVVVLGMDAVAFSPTQRLGKRGVGKGGWGSLFINA
ncbi:hypothetical protein DH2020_048184 [Rehmannia glutinosa]|uniref:Uncharacterized protein n=1 Tax=Rehmannia glutinosa TaxID=99300 RepID=A0ABR0U6D6_REHGL